MERSKRVSRPNKRYMLEAADVIPKKIKKATKILTGTSEKKIQRISKLSINSKTAEVPEKDVKNLAETTTIKAPAEKEGLMMHNESAAEKIKSLIKATPSKPPTEKEALMMQNESDAEKNKSLIKAGDLETAKSGNEAENGKQQKKNYFACKKHQRKKSKKFTIDCADVEHINVHDVLNYMRCNIKIDGQKNNFGNQIKLCADGKKIVLSGKTDLTMQYLKGLAKQFLRKNKLYCVRVINNNPVLKYVHND